METIDCPEFDTEKYVLGDLCKHGHNYCGTGQSLRYLYRGRVTGCVDCGRQRSKTQRQTQPDKMREHYQRSRNKPEVRNKRLAKRREDFASQKPLREAIALQKRAENKLQRERVRQNIAIANEMYCVDTSIYTLRVLCKRQHNYLASGWSLATGTDIFRGSCIECRRESRAKGSASMNYRGRKGAAFVVPFNRKDLDQRLKEFNHCCGYCGTELRRDFMDCKKADYLNWDHIIPLAKDGYHAIFNLVPSCKSCNGSKRDKDIFEWYQSSLNIYSKERAKMIVETLLLGVHSVILEG